MRVVGFSSSLCNDWVKKRIGPNLHHAHPLSPKLQPILRMLSFHVDV